jgi:hypothetical protein
LKQRVLRVAFLTFFCGCGAAFFAAQVQAQPLGEKNSQFVYRDRWGHMTSAPVIHRFSSRIVHPGGSVDPRINSTLRRAATIAEERSNARSKGRCWQYVKEALVASGAVSSYPKTAYAGDAGEELVRTYGFTKLSIRDPYKAPVGAVVVYGSRGRGHVEIRTKDGFASDYHSNNACFYRPVAIYAKTSN